MISPYPSNKLTVLTPNCLRKKAPHVATLIILILSVAATVLLSGCSLRQPNRHGDLVLVKKKRTFALKATPSSTWLLKTDWIPLNECGTVILQTKDLPPNIVIGEFQLQFRSRDFLKAMERARSAEISIVVTDEKGKKLYSKNLPMASLNWMHKRSQNIAFAAVEELEKALTGYSSYKIQISILKPAPDFKGRFRIAGAKPVWNTNQ